MNVNEAARKYAAIPEEGRDELNSDKLNGFKAGASFKAELMDIENVTRVEVIDNSGRSYVNMGVKSLQLSYQDDGRTLKLFINRKYE